jgi:hypothetical protein
MGGKSDMICRHCGRDYEGSRRKCPICDALASFYLVHECPKCGERMMLVVSTSGDDGQARDVSVHVSSGSMVCSNSK